MTISVHPARQLSEDVPPGTWEGTKQDAVLATAQLVEVLSRKKSGEKTQFGYSEYDAQMANAQLRAFKLTKVIMRKTKRSSLSDAPVLDVPVKIEDTGFQIDAPQNSDESERGSDTIPNPSPSPPPTMPLPTPPKRSSAKSSTRSKSLSPSGRKINPTPVVLPSKIPPPIPPRKSSHRNSQLPPPVAVPSRRYSDEVSPKTVPLSPVRSARPASPVPRNISPRRDTSPEKPETEGLPVLPYRRVKFETQETEAGERCDTPLPTPKPPYPQRSPLRSSIVKEVEATPPLMPKRGSIKRSVSFRFGEGLQNSTLSRTSSLICHELSDALKDLQRTIGAATLEVH
jgi:hypothetical protein